MTRRHVVLGLLGAAAIAGCSATIQSIGKGSARELVPFIEDGKTTRADVVAKLGNPVDTFEQGKIVTYRMRPTGDGLSVAGSLDKDASYELVLSFDERNVLRRHNLLRLW